MVTFKEVEHLLKANPPPSNGESPNHSKDDGTPDRTLSAYHPLHTFRLDRQRSYKQQYGDMYFLRLAKIKPAVDEAADAAWRGTVIGGEEVTKVDRVLDVRQGELCWVSGTVYMDMALKPNILDDVSKDRWISAPVSTQRYYSDDNDADQVMLEDESGRVRLVGEMLKSFPLVTGCIVAVMGTENSSGEFEVIDVKFPDLPPQPERWALTPPAERPAPDSTAPSGRIALVSGLSFSGTDASHSLELTLLLEYLLGEAVSGAAKAEVARISRLIIAGDSISTTAATAEGKPDAVMGGAVAAGVPEKKPGAVGSNKKYGYDASAYNAIPSQLLDDFLAELLPSMPVTLMPGARDPANASYPQQPIHMAMFPRSRNFAPVPNVKPPPSPQQQGQKQEQQQQKKQKQEEKQEEGQKEAQKQKQKQQPGWFDSVTNPFEAEIDGWRVLGTGGQNVDDVFRYTESDDRLGMMEAMCRWRCCAPTAPDTLWSYPFQENEPFVLTSCPHLFFVGCQPEAGSKLIHGPQGQTVRLVTVPCFKDTKQIVLVDVETLEVSTVDIELVVT